MYELQYLAQPDLMVTLADGVTNVKFVDGKLTTDDKEVYKHLEKVLGHGLVRLNKPVKDKEAAEVKADSDAKTEAKAEKKAKAEK